MMYKFLAPLTLATSMALAGCSEKNQMSGMDMEHHSGAMTTADIPATAVDLHNTVCPVSGDKVGDSKFIAIYEGKVYHMCCSDCPTDFQKDPAKFAKLVAADPAKYGVK